MHSEIKMSIVSFLPPQFLSLQFTSSKIYHKFLDVLPGQHVVIRKVHHLRWNIKDNQYVVLVSSNLSKLTQAVRGVISQGVEENHRWFTLCYKVFCDGQDDFFSAFNCGFLAILNNKGVKKFKYGDMIGKLHSQCRHSSRKKIIP